MVIVPDGSLLLVLNVKGNYLSIIDVASQIVIENFPVGLTPHNIALLQMVNP